MLDTVVRDHTNHCYVFERKHKKRYFGIAYIVAKVLTIIAVINFSMNRLLKKIGKYILYLFGVIIVLVLGVLLVISISSSGKPEPVVDAGGDPLPHSIALINDTVINGALQRLTIRGHDQSNPVLLRVHGGPGKVEPPQAYRFNNTDLEEYFTVCYWDQRGVGPAFDGNVSEQSYTIEQIVNDGLIVTEYLRETIGQDKIYIEGTSTGTVIASFMVREKPQYYQAYIGVAQLADGKKNEELSYDFVLTEANRRGDTLAIKELTRIGSPPYESIEKGNEAVQIERFYADKYMPKSPTDMSSIDVMKLIFLYNGWSMS
ncbi:MAG: alpha/beta hydrolase, partial [Cyclobacteriaceae bacterium]